MAWAGRRSALPTQRLADLRLERLAVAKAQVLLVCGPIFRRFDSVGDRYLRMAVQSGAAPECEIGDDFGAGKRCVRCRSEEHTSELQSPCTLVCRLLLDKKTISRN